jgi:hypothetical protein
MSSMPVLILSAESPLDLSHFQQVFLMNVTLIHGMGRTPLSMLVLRHRLRAAGFKPKLFGYSPMFESFDYCVGRVIAHVRENRGNGPYALIGHSLGTVLIRAALPQLEEYPPFTCFFLAPPSQASRAAQYFSANPVYKLLTGEMGQLLANHQFMDELPAPQVPTRIYAGTCDLSGRFSAFNEPNDSVLTVRETQGKLPILPIPIHTTHTFIMNSRQVADDIISVLKEYDAR